MQKEEKNSNGKEGIILATLKDGLSRMQDSKKSASNMDAPLFSAWIRRNKLLIRSKALLSTIKIFKSGEAFATKDSIILELPSLKKIKLLLWEI